MGDVNDNAPAFTIKLYTFYIPEGQSYGDYVGTVFAEDADVGVNARRVYTIDPEDEYFYIDSIYSEGSGVIKSKKVNEVSYRTSHIGDATMQVGSKVM